MKVVLNTRFDHKYGRWLNERTRRGPAEVSFLPPCFLLPWDTADSRESAGPLQWRIQAPLIFSSNWSPKGRKKRFLRLGSPLISGSGWPPPQPLSEGLSEQIPSAFSIPLHWPKHSVSSVGKCSFCLCYTYNTSLSLFFIKQERISRHLSLGLLVIFVLFLILCPKFSDLLSRRGLAECWDCWNCNL